MLKVSIIGHLGQDAQLKTFNNVNYVSFSVAHSEKYKNSKGEDVEKTQWVSCLKRLGESEKIVQLLKKGSKVYVEGSMSAKTFDNKGVAEVALNCNVSYLDVTIKESSVSSTVNQNQPTMAEPNPVVDRTKSSDAPVDDLPF